MDGLRIERGGTVILDEVSWRVTRGQHWVILGANGSGKTSLLSALTGYLMPTAGKFPCWEKLMAVPTGANCAKKIGIVSSSVRQMMADEEPALESVASGKYAMIDFWGRLTRREKAEALATLAAGRVRIPRPAHLARAFPGRTPARVDRPRAHGPAAAF